MKTICLGWIILCMSAHYAHSMNNLRLPDIRSLAMGENGVTQSVFYNPALLAFRQCKEIHMTYYNRYLIKELGSLNGSFYYPSSFLSSGVHISSFGYDSYRESMIRGLMSKQLNNSWFLGLSFQYSFLQTDQEADKSSYLSTDIGMVCRITDNLLIGLFIMNFSSASIQKEGIEIKDFTEYKVETGFQYLLMNRVLIAGTVGYTPSTFLRGSFGLEYGLLDQFRIYAGIKTTPLLPSFGCSYTFSRFTIDVAALFHPVLGVSTGVGIHYSF
ncbi:MAG: hypothetical protein LUG51_12750 [Tannerellaceae bacterium]|nr:hypothetical protein [Tannerellaceae bacterium]